MDQLAVAAASRMVPQTGAISGSSRSPQVSRTRRGGATGPNSDIRLACGWHRIDMRCGGKALAWFLPGPCAGFRCLTLTPPAGIGGGAQPAPRAETATAECITAYASALPSLASVAMPAPGSAKAPLEAQVNPLTREGRCSVLLEGIEIQIRLPRCFSPAVCRAIFWRWWR